MGKTTRKVYYIQMKMIEMLFERLPPDWKWTSSETSVQDNGSRLSCVEFLINLGKETIHNDLLGWTPRTFHFLHEKATVCFFFLKIYHGGIWSIWSQFNFTITDFVSFLTKISLIFLDRYNYKKIQATGSYFWYKK